MFRIRRNHLPVLSLEGLQAFYGDLLGMEVLGSDDEPVFGFDPDQCCLAFRATASAPHKPGQHDFCWKIGITLRDLDAAVVYLRSRGVELRDPIQFLDIGYMTKLVDPNGFIIELLQQEFEGHHCPAPAGHPIADQATLAHITLRVTDLEAAKAFFESDLGMRLMSVQPVHEYAFCLYFYCWSDEPLPDPDLASVANRAWLWARPYAFIELQHLELPTKKLRKVGKKSAGFDGFSFGAPGAAKARYVPVDAMKGLK
ncbi:MAG: VOC family protein [Alphaproteobacteria bacterium]|nr:VOC family protein [Alphaproteobacteria bacterium]